MKNTAINLLIMVIVLNMAYCEMAHAETVNMESTKDPNIITSKYKGLLKTNNSIRDVVNHPSFKGFSKLTAVVNSGHQRYSCCELLPIELLSIGCRG
jgi:hypothetical protein